MKLLHGYVVVVVALHSFSIDCSQASASRNRLSPRLEKVVLTQPQVGAKEQELFEKIRNNELERRKDIQISEESDVEREKKIIEGITHIEASKKLTIKLKESFFGGVQNQSKLAQIRHALDMEITKAHVTKKVIANTLRKDIKEFSSGDLAHLEKSMYWIGKYRYECLPMKFNIHVNLALNDLNGEIVERFVCFLEADSIFARLESEIIEVIKQLKSPCSPGCCSGCNVS